MTEVPEWRKRSDDLRARNDAAETKVVEPPNGKHEKPDDDELDVETK